MEEVTTKLWQCVEVQIGPDYCRDEYIKNPLIIKVSAGKPMGQIRSGNNF